ncbi:hypothetical protein VitviT2T_021465 [Vitis vinifera]|uniref:CG-1 domain-containing protein n=1 Tax=Vitis vinifera TaxID=29760 RepID=A0ABY9D726_VITVI|nr:hypothetical protein VitviT2T_021465 [Vitis vinifera]
MKPTSGSLFFFNKRVIRFFRKDGHSLRKKKDERIVGEAHEHLKRDKQEMIHMIAGLGFEWALNPILNTGVSINFYPIVKTTTSIASTSGHKELAGYLFEVVVTSHLSSLMLEESELSKGFVEVEAEITTDRISKGGLAASGD